jgi:UDP-glucuronate 4-epimerase
VNVEGTATVLRLALERGLRRVVFASSSSVYGNSTPLPAREEARADDPASPYAATKRAAELVASALALAAPEASVAALRFFTVYGPRQRPEMAITRFCRAALRGDAVPLFGDGSMRRDFTHVDDITRGVLAAADAAPRGFRVYNLGSSSPVDLATLLALIGEVAGRAVPAVATAVPLGDVEATFADTSRARGELGWAPRIPLRDGLRTVMDWLRRAPD